MTISSLVGKPVPKLSPTAVKDSTLSGTQRDPAAEFRLQFSKRLLLRNPEACD